MQTQALARPRRHRAGVDETALAWGLGWFSVGLGFARVGAPGVFARLIGLPDTAATRRVLQASGAREIASGVAGLVRPESAVPLWARVAGDAVDLAALALSLGGRRVRHGRLLAAMAAVAGVAALDVLAGRQRERASEADRPVTATITIQRTPVQVYAAWRNLEDLPRFLAAIAEVRSLGDGSSRWTAVGPAGAAVEWVAALVDDQPGERIAWQTVEGAVVEHEGEVTFRPAPGDRGTEVRWSMRCGTRGGAVGTAIARAFAAPKMLADLRRFKQVLETGALVRSDASIHLALHPARPSDGAEASAR